MDPLDYLAKINSYIKKLKAAALRDSVKKKTPIRRRFYVTLKDFIQGAGNRPPHAYFSWYEKQLDTRMKVQPSWKKAYYRLTKTKSDQTFRSFLKACDRETSKTSDFFSIIKAWLPDDEFRILKSAQSSDIRREINLAIQVCEEKERSRQKIISIIKKNIPLFVIGFVIHTILYQFVYANFVSMSEIQGVSFFDLSLPEKNYVVYEFFLGNWLAILMALSAFFAFLAWSNKNWHKKGFNIRVNYFDFIPPYSISKIKEQYNFLMLLNSFIQSGKNFQDALDETAAGASPYVKRHIAEIKRQSTKAANEAINIPFLGEYGCDIRDRGENISLSEAISELLPDISRRKDEKMDAVVGISMWLTTKPLVYGTLGISAAGVVMSILELVTSSGVLSSM